MRDTDTTVQDNQPTDLRDELKALTPNQLRQAMFYLLGYDRDTADRVIAFAKDERE